MLLWRSDEALRLYARLNDFEYSTWLDVAASSQIDTVRTSNVRHPGIARKCSWTEDREPCVLEKGLL